MVAAFVTDPIAGLRRLALAPVVVATVAACIVVVAAQLAIPIACFPCALERLVTIAVGAKHVPPPFTAVQRAALDALPIAVWRHDVCLRRRAHTPRWRAGWRAGTPGRRRQNQLRRRPWRHDVCLPLRRQAPPHTPRRRAGSRAGTPGCRNPPRRRPAWRMDPTAHGQESRCFLQVCLNSVKTEAENGDQHLRRRRHARRLRGPRQRRRRLLGARLLGDLRVVIIDLAGLTPDKARLLLWWCRRRRCKRRWAQFWRVPAFIRGEQYLVAVQGPRQETACPTSKPVAIHDAPEDRVVPMDAVLRVLVVQIHGTAQSHAVVSRLWCVQQNELPHHVVALLLQTPHRPTSCKSLRLREHLPHRPTSCKSLRLREHLAFRPTVRRSAPARPGIRCRCRCLR